MTIHPFTQAILDTGNRIALEEATARRIASYQEFSLGDIRADRTKRIRNRKHSVSHKAIGSFA